MTTSFRKAAPLSPESEASLATLVQRVLDPRNAEIAGEWILGMGGGARLLVVNRDLSARVLVQRPDIRHAVLEAAKHGLCCSFTVWADSPEGKISAAFNFGPLPWAL